MAQLESAQNKNTFKKRSHRPWKPSLLEQTIHNSNHDVTMDEEIESTENLILPTEQYANKSKVVMQSKSDLSSDNSLSIGGFYKAKGTTNNLDQTVNNIRVRDTKFLAEQLAQGALEQIQEAQMASMKAQEQALHAESLRSDDLRAKKILEHKFNHTMEQLAVAEQAKLDEEALRLTAVNKLNVLSKALQEAEINQQLMQDEKNAAEAKAQKAIGQFYVLENARADIEQTFQEQTRENKRLQSSLILLENEIKSEQKKVCESEILANQALETIQQLKKEIAGLKDQIHGLTLENDKLKGSSNIIKNEILTERKTIIALKDTINEEKYKLKLMKEDYLTLELERKQNQENLKKIDSLNNLSLTNGEKIAGLNSQNAKLSRQNDQFHKDFEDLKSQLFYEKTQKNELETKFKQMQSLLNNERKLRQCTDKKIELIQENFKKVDFDRQVEIAARRAAEDKAEKTVNETGKALVHLLSQSKTT